MISGFSHVALYTADLESAIRFYTGVFDAENLGCFTTERRGCWLRLGRDVLEVFESLELPDGRFKHIALECDDVDGTFSKASEVNRTEGFALEHNPWWLRRKSR